MLFNRIMNRIHKERQFLIRKRIVVFALLFMGSLIAVFPAFRALEKSITESGFMQFLSLIFTDFRMVVTYWQSFVLSLLESLPIINLTIFLIIILAFLESIKFLARDIRSFLPQHNY